MKKKIKPRSAKNKGTKFQDYISKTLSEVFELEYGTDKDLKGRPMGNAGTDIVMSKKAKELIPFDIECKNQEKWSIPAWWEQTLKNTSKNRKPLLLIKKNRTDPLALIKYSDLLELLKKEEIELELEKDTDNRDWKEIEEETNKILEKIKSLKR